MAPGRCLSSDWHGGGAQNALERGTGQEGNAGRLHACGREVDDVGRVAGAGVKRGKGVDEEGAAVHRDSPSYRLSTTPNNPSPKWQPQPRHSGPSTGF